MTATADGTGDGDALAVGALVAEAVAAGDGVAVGSGDGVAVGCLVGFGVGGGGVRGGGVFGGGVCFGALYGGSVTTAKADGKACGCCVSVLICVADRHCAIIAPARARITSAQPAIAT